MRGAIIIGSFTVLIAGSLPVAAAPPTTVDLEDGADHHVAAQGSYKGGLRHSWEWVFGSRSSAPNITGINAHGLLAAHRLTGLKEHEDAALRAARSLIAMYDKGWNKRRPHTQDIEFLVAAGFVIDAAKWFRQISARWSAPGYVDHVVDRRGAAGLESLAGWDVASAIRAAVAVGEVNYARAMVDRSIQRRASWDRNDTAASLSRASLLWALATFRGRSQLTAVQARFADSLRRGLVAAQTAEGAWATADGKQLHTQLSAYAVLGLDGWPAGKAAATRGRRWLQQVAQSDQQHFVGGRIWATTYVGARPGTTYVSEVQSEVLQALASGN